MTTPAYRTENSPDQATPSIAIPAQRHPVRPQVNAIENKPLPKLTAISKNAAGLIVKRWLSYFWRLRAFKNTSTASSTNSYAGRQSSMALIFSILIISGRIYISSCRRLSSRFRSPIAVLSDFTIRLPIFE
jgi:hypothetical protein